MASEPPTSGAGPNRLSPLRAGIILVGFIVAAILLVNVGSRPPVTGVALTPTGGTVTTVANSGSTTTTAAVTTTTLARSATSVQVANGSHGAGLAEHYSAFLTGLGWATKPPANASSDTIATSAVYYLPGQQEAAAAIATELKLQSTAVHPLTAAVPVANAVGNDVVVVIGADLASQTNT